MRKILFSFLCLVCATAISAANFQQNTETGMYYYVGSAVDSVVLDFTTWTADSLSDEAVGSNYTSGPHTLALTERGGCAFQKWVIYPNRWLMSGVTKNALFNNGKDNGTFPLAELPLIYFPTVKNGVKTIVFNGVSNWVTVIYQEGENTEWKQLASFKCNGKYAEDVFEIDSIFPQRIAMYVNGTGYTSVTNIKILPKEEETPVSAYVLQDSMYTYTGEPVDAVDLDFTTWTTDSLYDAAVGDNYTSGPHTMGITERGGCAFQKWVIYPNRWLMSGVTKNALFNNGKENGTAKLDELPMIYFPTVKNGVKKIVFNGVTNWLKILYQDDANQEWKSLLNYKCNGKYAEEVIEIDSINPKRIAMYVDGTGYTSVTNIQLIPVEVPTSMYVLQDSMYTYVGEPVNEVDLDFTTWTADSLYDEAVGDNYTSGPHTMGITERGGCAFQKWVIYPNRWLMSGVTKNALFNNGKENGTAKLDELPMIYFPTIESGVKTIVFNGVTNWLKILYQDDANQEWKSLLNYKCNGKYAEEVIELDSINPKRIAMYVDGTGYTSVTNIKLVPMGNEPTPMYVLQDSMYTYVGKPVQNIELDFTTWTADSLSDEAVGSNYTSGPHTMGITERGGCAFQKWVIYPNRWLMSGVTKNALFNNGKENGTAKLDELPMIYFPTIESGVKRIIFNGVANWLKILYQDDANQEWRSLLNYKCNGKYAEEVIEIDSINPKRIAMYVDGTGYTSVTNIKIVSMADKKVGNYEYVPSANTWKYVGEPVDEIYLDFTTWSVDSLPATLSDDMDLAEAANCGFVKWKILANDATVGGPALFNNGNGDFSGGPTNPNTTNPPMIYLPTTSRGVKSIRFKAYNGGNVSFAITYSDNKETDKYFGGIVIPKQFEEASAELNTSGPTSIRMKYTGTAWIRVAELEVILEDDTNVVAVSEITLDKHAAELEINKTLQLTATVSPENATDKTVTWSSSDVAIATVENGLVTGLSEGRVVIKAEAGHRKDSCVIDVRSQVVPATAIRWNVSDKTIKLNFRDSLEVSYTIEPENATNRSAIVYSADPDIASYKEGMIYARGGGETTVYVALDDLIDSITVNVFDPNRPVGELDWDPDGTYWGDSVDYIWADFTTWPKNALLSREKMTEDIQQYAGLGFVRWYMKERPTLLSPGVWDQNDVRMCLFTDNPEIDGHITSEDGHHAIIYLPTLRHGAGAMRLSGFASAPGGESFAFQLSYYTPDYSETGGGYKYIKNVFLPGDGSNMSETSLDIEEPVTLQIQWIRTPWPSFWSIQVSPYGMPLSDDPDTDFGHKDGLENTTVNTILNSYKVMIDGQLYIIHNGTKYNVVGQKVK